MYQRNRANECQSNNPNNQRRVTMAAVYSFTHPTITEKKRTFQITNNGKEKHTRQCKQKVTLCSVRVTTVAMETRPSIPFVLLRIYMSLSKK
jgi:hypothetical protein